MEIVNDILMAAGGALASLAVVSITVLPRKVSRDEVQSMLDRLPLHERLGSLEERFDKESDKLESIRQEIVLLRQDVVELTTTLGMIVKRWSDEK